VNTLVSCVIVQIEDEDASDYSRHTPPLAADGQSYFFHALNRGKQSVRFIDYRILYLHRLGDVEFEEF